MIASDDETGAPGRHVFGLQERAEGSRKSQTPGSVQAQDQEPVVGPGLVAPRVREIQVLGDKKAALGLCRFPDVLVGAPT